MRWVLCAFIVAGCAKAGPATLNEQVDASVGDDDQPIDAPVRPPIDAPVMLTLSQTVNNTVSVGNSLGCLDGNNQMADTHWYRVFQPSDQGVTGTFFVQSVTIATQNSQGTPTVTFNIGSYAGAIGGTTIDKSMITPLATAMMQVPANTNPSTLEAPLVATIPPGGRFVVEIAVPQQNGNNKFVFIGATTAGETHPGYWSAIPSGCSNNVIETTVAGGSSGQIIINVNGTH